VTRRSGGVCRSAEAGALGGQVRSRWPRPSPTAMESRQHLLVQAGTGTGKSLAYLVPSLLHDRVVVATATLALQHQLVERDIPRLVEAISQRASKGIDTSYAVLKGRSNYACLHRIREGVPDDQGTLVDVPQGSIGEEGARAARVGRGGGQGRRHRRARQRPAAHRPRVAPGQRSATASASAPQVPVRRGVLRRASRRRRRTAPTWSSPTTRCSRSTPSRACR
jgi:ATP-dependent DNA helicase DinG